jgi:phosphoenolpyruvate-protein phosphotransferase
LIVDGARGRVLVEPEPSLVAQYENFIQKERLRAVQTHKARHKPAITKDGRRVEIAANIGSWQDAVQAVEQGADAVGLFRTEFLFLDRTEPPDEDEQFEAYRAVARALGGRSLLIRTLDIGGDKPVPYVKLPREANPFLGLRGLRLSLAQPALFVTQLKAILRVANDFPVRVMYPMVSTPDEFRRAEEWMRRARDELRARGVVVPDKVETGMMVEVPAAALAANAFARQVDFISIGTNDLTQYTLAAERGNPHVAALVEGISPAVLALVEGITRAAHPHGKWVGVCGEMAGEPEAIPLLVGLGVDELSMAAPLIPRAKEIVRELAFSDARTAAQRAIGDT